MEWDLDDIIGSIDIATIFGVVPSTVANWKRRHKNTFPKPIKYVSNGTPLYSKTQILWWYNTHHN